MLTDRPRWLPWLARFACLVALGLFLLAALAADGELTSWRSGVLAALGFACLAFALMIS